MTPAIGQYLQSDGPVILAIGEDANEFMINTRNTRYIRLTQKGVSDIKEELQPVVCHDFPLSTYCNTYRSAKAADDERHQTLAASSLVPRIAAHIDRSGPQDELQIEAYSDLRYSRASQDEWRDQFDQGRAKGPPVWTEMKLGEHHGVSGSWNSLSFASPYSDHVKSQTVVLCYTPRIDFELEDIRRLEQKDLTWNALHASLFISRRSRRPGSARRALPFPLFEPCLSGVVWHEEDVSEVIQKIREYSHSTDIEAHEVKRFIGYCRVKDRNDVSIEVAFAFLRQKHQIWTYGDRETVQHVNECLERIFASIYSTRSVEIIHEAAYIWDLVRIADHVFHAPSSIWESPLPDEYASERASGKIWFALAKRLSELVEKVKELV